MTPQEAVTALMRRHFFHFGFYRVSKWVVKRKMLKIAMITSFIIAFIAGHYCVVTGQPSKAWPIAWYFLFFVAWGILTAIDRAVMLRTLQRIRTKYHETYPNPRHIDFNNFNGIISQTQWKWVQ